MHPLVERHADRELGSVDRFDRRAGSDDLPNGKATCDFHVRSTTHRSSNPIPFSNVTALSG